MKTTSGNSFQQTMRRISQAVWEWMKRSKFCFVLFNMLLAGLVSVILLWLLFHYMDNYTEHGVEVQVPDVKLKHIVEARPLLEQEQLELVVMDSSYSELPVGTIVDQVPGAGMNVKHGRKIYVTISCGKRKVMVPNVINYSERQAMKNLESAGLSVDSIAYEAGDPGVMDIRNEEGESLSPGTLLNEGTRLVLVVGRNSGMKVMMPNLIGSTEQAALDKLKESHLKARIEHDPVDNMTDEQLAELAVPFYVYYQEYQAGEELEEASEVVIRLSVNIEKAFNNNIEDSSDDDILW